MADPTVDLKTQLDAFVARNADAKAKDEIVAADLEALLEAYRNSSPRIPSQSGSAEKGANGESSLKLSMALLKFHEGVLVFSSAIIGAVFIGFPNIRFFGDGLITPSEYVHALGWLALAAVVTAVTALATQLQQQRINNASFETFKKAVGTGKVAALMTLFSAAAIACGGVAAYPFVCRVWPS